MITVSVASANKQYSGKVQVHGFDKLTPRAARAALEIAGYFTGSVRQIYIDRTTEESRIIEYRVYDKSARKTVDELYPIS